MKNALSPILLILFVAIIFVITNTAFLLPETKSAIVLRIGEPTAEHTVAGLKFKIPFLENVIYIDKRNRELDQEEIVISATGQEELKVDAFARYRIIEPLLFYQTLRTELGGENRLKSLMNQNLRSVLGRVTVDDIVSGERAALMISIRDQLSGSAREFGVEIIDVKIRQTELPELNSQAVFKRMITDRQQEAQQYRAEGNQLAQQIQAQADKEATKIRSEAEEESQKIRGAADAERNAVFNAAYSKDAEFFAFYRSLQAYEEALLKGDTKILLSPNSEFFKYFNDLEGKRN